MSLRARIVEYVSRRYEEEGRVPSVRQILREFGIYRALFYQMFPEGLEELCRKAKVPFPADRARLAEAMKAKGRSAKKLSIEHGDFDFEYRKSDLEARVRELGYTFKLRTEDVKNEPYWRAKREQFSSLCNWMLKRVRKAETSAELEAIAEDF